MKDLRPVILKIVAALAIAVAGIFIYAATVMPKSFRIVRSIVIAAPAADIFPYVNNMKKMNSWNPWMKLDPNVKVTYTGPEEGLGAASEWDGNSNVGAGRATVTHSFPPYLVRLNMEWFKPMDGASTVDYSLKQVGDSTTMEWIMLGKNNFISRVMCIFMDRDKIVGGEFEKGLAELKNAVEKRN